MYVIFFGNISVVTNIRRSIVSRIQIDNQYTSHHFYAKTFELWEWRWILKNFWIDEIIVFHAYEWFSGQLSAISKVFFNANVINSDQLIKEASVASSLQIPDKTTSLYILHFAKLQNKH